MCQVLRWWNYRIAGPDAYLASLPLPGKDSLPQRYDTKDRKIFYKHYEEQAETELDALFFYDCNRGKVDG